MRITTCALLAMSLIGGCSAPFLHSTSISGEVLKDPGLSGEWISEGKQETHAIVHESADGHYAVSLTVRQGNDFTSTVQLDTTLTQIGEDRYWDLFLDRAERDKLVQQYGFLAVPVHQVMKVSRQGDELTVWPFNPEWLEEAAARGSFSLDRVAVGGGEISMLTGSTEQVRALIKRYGNEPKAFGKPITLHRASK